MTLNRGQNGLYPCPVCLVPAAELSNLWKTWQLRQNSDVEWHVANRASMTKGALEAHLKAHGLRPVEVCSKSSYTVWL